MLACRTVGLVLGGWGGGSRGGVWLIQLLIYVHGWVFGLIFWDLFITIQLHFQAYFFDARVLNLSTVGLVLAYSTWMSWDLLLDLLW